MKLSIITINRNNAAGLSRTIESVVSQTYTDFEYIVIDGASTDESVGVIKEYADRITYWVSEPDKGIYNAMNKGILKAKGEYLLFMNSGDWLVDDVLLQLADYLTEYDIIYGNWYKVFDKDNIEPEQFPDIVTFQFLAFNYSLPHQAAFIKRNLFESLNYYDEGLKMVSDWKFFLDSLFKYNCTYKHISIYISYYDKNGFSSDENNNQIQKYERNKVIQEGYKNFIYINDELNENTYRLWRYDKSKIVLFFKKIGFFRF